MRLAVEEIARFRRDQPIDPDDAEAAIAVEAAIRFEGRQSAEAHGHGGGRARDRPEHVDAAECFALAEGARERAVGFLFEIFRDIAEIAAEQIGGGARPRLRRAAA